MLSRPATCRRLKAAGYEPPAHDTFDPDGSRELRHAGWPTRGPFTFHPDVLADVRERVVGIMRAEGTSRARGCATNCDEPPLRPGAARAPRHAARHAAGWRRAGAVRRRSPAAATPTCTRRTLEPGLRRREPGRAALRAARRRDRPRAGVHEACGADPEELHGVELYSSHEALLLEYERR